jgi:hypothetical protein
MNPFVEQHRDEIGCVLSCFERVVITGTLPDICHLQCCQLKSCQVRADCQDHRINPTLQLREAIPRPWLQGVRGLGMD